MVVHHETPLFSPQRSQHVHRTCVRERPWLNSEQESQDVTEWTKGVGGEAAIFVSNAHEMISKKHSASALKSATHFNLIENRQHEEHLAEYVAGIDEREMI